MHAEWLGIVVVILYMLIMLALSAYGINFLYISFMAPRVRRQRVECPLPQDLPFVTVQLPIFNERFVAERVIEAASCLEWPQDRIEIQVLDDSTDDTRDIVARAVAHWQAEGVDITLMHREDRKGFKAGALSEGLERAKGEFVALFDADFVPEPDFLRRTVGCLSDPRVAYVQARWEHLNRDTSLLCPLMLLAPAPGGWNVVLTMVGMALLPTAAAPVYFCLTGQRLLRPRTWWREIPYVLSLWLLGAGLMVSNSRALWRGLHRRPAVFERTPKWGLVGGRTKVKPTGYRPTGDGLVVVELIVAGVNVATAVLAFIDHNLGLGLSAALLATGLIVVAAMTLRESWTTRHAS